MRSGCPPKPWRRRTRFGGFRRRHKKDHGCKAVGLHCDQDLRSGERCTTSSDWTFSQLVAHQGLRHRPGLALQESVGDCKCQSWAAPPPFIFPGTSTRCESQNVPVSLAAGGRKGMRSFLCSRSARPLKGLARRPQSKAPHALAWLGIELGTNDTRSGRPSARHQGERLGHA